MKILHILTMGMQVNLFYSLREHTFIKKEEILRMSDLNIFAKEV